jgi:hypothetical protein
MKENGWVVGVLWGFEPFSHGNYHIRVYMLHVCLFQSISARKVTRIKLGTCSGSSQYQLHSGTKMVSIEWSGCEWLPVECKNEHFQAFPLLAPSGLIVNFCIPSACTIVLCMPLLHAGCWVQNVQAKSISVHCLEQKKKRVRPMEEGNFGITLPTWLSTHAVPNWLPVLLFTIILNFNRES